MVRKSSFALTLILLSLGMARNWTGQDFSPQGAHARSEALSTFRQAAEIVLANAPERIDEKDLADQSLEAMLQKLDPHSNYFTAEAFKELMEDQEGKFSGLGMMVTKPTADSPLLVVLPLPETPASRAGIRAGDLILEIDSLPTAKMTNREAVRHLKGPEGTEVTLKLGRGGDRSDILKLQRASIPKHTVPYAFMLDDTVGYLKMNMFGQTTAAEVDENIARLQRDGMRGLVLDVRDNPGGSLAAAIQVASLFLPRGDDVVSVRGRNAERQIFHRTSREGRYKDLPLVMMANESSASASEILCGALQDQRRARVVGERTWGKGLVQTVTPLDRGAVSLTTARYYTPSGRIIQRDFSRSYDDYLFPELAKETADARAAAGDSRAETAGRAGGVVPDVEVTAGKIPPLALRLERRRAFLDFVAKEIEGGKLSADRIVPEDLVRKFKAQLDAKLESYTPEEWSESLAYTTQALQREAFTMLQGQGQGARAMIPLDEQLTKAWEMVEAECPAREKKAA